MDRQGLTSRKSQPVMLTRLSTWLGMAEPRRASPLRQSLRAHAFWPGGAQEGPRAHADAEKLAGRARLPLVDLESTLEDAGPA